VPAVTAPLPPDIKAFVIGSIKVLFGSEPITRALILACGYGAVAASHDAPGFPKLH
jgi:hypothetical protein